MLLFVVATPSLCFAWGGEGHQIVALIAENHLTPTAKAAIADLLDGAHISDAEVASWADEIRRHERDTADWHYVNIPHDAAAFDRKRDGHARRRSVTETWPRLRRRQDPGGCGAIGSSRHSACARSERSFVNEMKCRRRLSQRATREPAGHRGQAEACGGVREELRDAPRAREAIRPLG
jgi:hypothetical protein